MGEWPTYSLKTLQAGGALLVADGNHGEYRPRKHEFVESGFAFIRATDKDDGVINFATAFKINDEARQRIRKGIGAPGDVLISHKGTVGKVARAPSDAPSCVCNPQTTFWRFLDPSTINADFLYALMRSPGFHTLFSVTAGETDMAGYVSLTSQRELNIPVPSAFIQQSIAETIGALDDKIELNPQTNQTLEALARAIFKDWFVDFGPTRAKAKGRTPYLEPALWDLFPDRLDAEGKPEGWVARVVSDFAIIKDGKQLPKSLVLDGREIPVFGGAGLMGYTNQHNAQGFVITVGRVGAYCGLFYSHRGKAWINNDVSLISARPEVSGEWLLLALRELNIEWIRKGAAQPFVSNSDLAAMDLIGPGRTALGALHQLIQPLLELSEAKERENCSLAQTRDLLLPKLMSGEIRLRDAERMVEDAA